jgi:hypothetical protein
VFAIPGCNAYSIVTCICRKKIRILIVRRFDLGKLATHGDSSNAVGYLSGYFGDYWLNKKVIPLLTG